MANKGSPDVNELQSLGAGVPSFIENDFIDESQRFEPSTDEEVGLIAAPNAFPDPQVQQALGADVSLEEVETRDESGKPATLEDKGFGQIEIPNSSCCSCAMGAEQCRCRTECKSCVPVSSRKDETLFPMETEVKSQCTWHAMEKGITVSMSMLEGKTVTPDKSHQEMSESSLQPKKQTLPLEEMSESTAMPVREMGESTAVSTEKEYYLYNFRLVEALLDASSSISPLRQDASAEMLLKTEAAEFGEPASAFRRDIGETSNIALREAKEDCELISPKKSNSSDSNIELIEDRTEE